jgi:thiol:disulfide interchange protein DsbA
MRFLQKLLLTLGFGLLAASAGASVTAPQQGVEYTVLPRPQPTESGKKVEVIEFFGYFCPHCNALDPL